jgi:hypothetical protein
VSPPTELFGRWPLTVEDDGAREGSPLGAAAEPEVGKRLDGGRDTECPLMGPALADGGESGPRRRDGAGA